ncbi:MAG: serine hydrolase [Acetobacteraceae bacterium]|nr:serine hydrolase [Acetobacteraceae bacterium]
MDADIGGWARWQSPEQVGWSGARLAEARAFSGTINTAGVMVVAGGKVVDAWGEVGRHYNVHSIRKSFLSALYGIHEADGRIDLEATLGALGIDDKEGLSERETLASVIQLLAARSGVYHPSGYESPNMLAIKPARHSSGPGVTWCYNNWDFNALGTIFRQVIGADIYADFKARIADAIGMEDHEPSRDCGYVPLEASIHPAYPFRMTARDLARFGELFLRGGVWGGRQVVPAAWVAASVAPISDAGLAGSYGYMWWVARDGIHFPGVRVPEGTYSARGAGGHYIVVLPKLDAVVVHRVDTDVPGNAMSSGRFGALLRRILAASGV